MQRGHGAGASVRAAGAAGVPIERKGFPLGFYESAQITAGTAKKEAGGRLTVDQQYQLATYQATMAAAESLDAIHSVLADLTEVVERLAEKGAK